MRGLTENTASIFDNVSRLECIKAYILVGGTALSLQIDHRKSEDLDFMQRKQSKNEKKEVDWVKIQKELATVGNITQTDILGFDHVEFVVSNVKLSFYIADRKAPQMHPVSILNNIYAADISAIGAMKMEVLLRRSRFRDYYDIYSVLMEGVSFNSMMYNALQHSNHRLKSKTLVALLTDASRFAHDEHFIKLEPKYNVTANDIELYIRNIVIDSNLEYK